MNVIIAFLTVFNLNEDSNPNLCDAGAVRHQLSYQASWEQVVVGENDECQLSNGDCVTEKKCGY